MNRIRMGLSITILLGVIYAFAGLFDSLGHFALGVIVAAGAVIGYGLVDFIESRRDNRIHQTRQEVWARRDAVDTRCPICVGLWSPWPCPHDRAGADRNQGAA